MTFEEWFNQRGYDRFYHYQACKDAWFASHKQAEELDKLKEYVVKLEGELDILKNDIKIPS